MAIEITVGADLPMDRGHVELTPAIALTPLFRECHADQHPAARVASEVASAAFVDLFGSSQLIDANLDSLKAFAPGEQGFSPGSFELFEERKELFTKKTSAAVEAANTRIGNVAQQLEQMETSLRQEIDKKFTAPTALGLAQEIRAHVRGLPPHQQMKFCTAAAERGDTATLGAVLGKSAPFYLSGLSAEDHVSYRSLAESTICPSERLQADAIAKARERLGMQHGRFLQRWGSALQFAQPKALPKKPMRRT